MFSKSELWHINKAIIHSYELKGIEYSNAVFTWLEKVAEKKFKIYKMSIKRTHPEIRQQNMFVERKIIPRWNHY